MRGHGSRGQPHHYNASRRKKAAKSRRKHVAEEQQHVKLMRPRILLNPEGSQPRSSGQPRTHAQAHPTHVHSHRTGVSPSTTGVGGVMDGGAAAPIATPSVMVPPRRTHTRTRGQLLDAMLSITPDNVSPLLTDNDEYTCIGVIGTQGVGKSTIMNILAGCPVSEEHGSPKQDLSFHQASVEDVIRARHLTKGIDLAVTQERTILLDCQPLLSASVLGDMMSDARGDRKDHTSIAQKKWESQSLQLAIFMLSICDVVIVVQEDVVNVRFLNFLKAVDMLKCGLPGVSVGPKNDKSIREHPCNVVFVYTKQNDEMFALDQREWVTRVLAQFLEETTLTSTHSASDMHVDASAHTSMEKYCVHFLPIASEEKPFFAPAYACAAASLRRQLLSIPRHPHAHPPTELEWLKGAVEVWDVVKRSTLIEEYCRMEYESYG